MILIVLAMIKDAKKQPSQIVRVGGNKNQVCCIDGQGVLQRGLFQMNFMYS